MFKSATGFFLLIIFLFISYNTLSYRENAFDNGAYVAYSTSVVKDFDFNIFNNRSKEIDWVVSPTLNSPDMHDHGISLLWVPALIIARFFEMTGVSKIPSSRGVESVYTLFIFFASVLIFALSIKLIQKYIVELHTLQQTIILLFCFSTPLLFYTFIEFTSADIGCFFISLLIIIAAIKDSDKTPFKFFSWGVLLGISRVFKISFIFYLPLMLYLSYRALSKRKYRDSLFILSGFLLPIIFKNINDHIQFGQFSFFTGYDYDFYYQSSDFFASLVKNIFGPFGVIHQAPWVIFILIVGLVTLFNKGVSRDSKSLVFLICFAIISKFIYEVYTVSDAETEFGFRRYLLDVPFCIMILKIFFSEVGLSPQFHKFIFSTAACLFFYNILYFLWFRYIDQYNLSAFGIYKIYEYTPVLSEIRHYTFDIIHWLTDTRLFITLSLISVFSGGLWYFYPRFKNYSFSFYSIYFLLSYALITSLNMVFNPINVSQYSHENKYATTVIGNSFSIYLYDEIISELVRNLLIAKYNRNFDEFLISRDRLIAFAKNLNLSAVYDPIGFNKLIDSGHFKNTTFYKNVDVDNLLIFNSKTFYNTAFDIKL